MELGRSITPDLAINDFKAASHMIRRARRIDKHSTAIKIHIAAHHIAIFRGELKLTLDNDLGMMYNLNHRRKL